MCGVANNPMANNIYIMMRSFHILRLRGYNESNVLNVRECSAATSILRSSRC